MNCPKCNGEMWDNREKKTNPKAPDYKCKDQECGGAVWPPKNTTPSKPQNGRNETEIVRQHSQEMALMYYQTKGKKEFTPEELIKMIDFFESDAHGKKPEPKPIPPKVEDDEVNLDEIPF